MRLKRAAALSALTEVRSGMRLGLGTGSTVQHFLEVLALALADQELKDIVGVPTSVRTESESRRLGIPLASLEEFDRLDLCVDGADEVAPDLGLIKGLGGALLREKIVAQGSNRFLVIADSGKLVERLGTKAPVPVEMLPFSWRVHLRFLEDLGAEPVLRTAADGRPVVSDNGNLLVDCRFSGGVPDPQAVAARLEGRAGVVEHGLFLGLATECHVAGVGGVRRLQAGSG